MNKIFTKTLIFLFCFSLTFAQSKEPCNPDDLSVSKPSRVVNSAENQGKGDVFVYFDQSLSMKGYVVDQPGQKNLYVDVIFDVQQIAENIGSNVYYHAFGREIVSLNESQISRVIKPRFYECKGAAVECNNQESKINEPFEIAAIEEGTHIVVTDLFLDDKDLVGGTRKQITSPIKTILKNGKSVGIIGVMNSFNGTIFDIPRKESGTFEYMDAIKRPFYILVIGDQKNINLIKKNLEEQFFVDPGDEYKFALITSSPVLQNLNQNKVITENNIPRVSKNENFNFEYYDDNFPIYRFSTSKKKEYKLKIDLSEIEVPGSTGVSEYSIKEAAWTSNKIKCKDINWKKADYKKISDYGPKEKELVVDLFKFKPLKSLFRGMRYFYYLDIYAEKPGSASEKIFEDWSIKSTEAEDFTNEEPKMFKTLNLLTIIEILNNVASDTFEKTLIASIGIDFNLTK